MKTLEELLGRINSVEEMQSVVSTMKSLSAARIRQYESAADATQAYAQTIQLAFQILWRENRSAQPALAGAQESRRRGLVLFGSDQGFCGSFNEAISKSVVDFVAEHPNQENRRAPAVLIIGNRLNHLIESQGFTIEKSLRLPNSVAKITEVIQHVLVQIEAWQGSAEVDQVEVFFNYRKSAASFGTKHLQLLPISKDFLDQLREQPWESRSLPVYPGKWQDLFSNVVQQHLFLQLFLACTESLASENASRIAAMQQAEANIEQRLSELNTEFNQSRQTAITEELLDIITGFEAASDPDP